MSNEYLEIVDPVTGMGTGIKKLRTLVHLDGDWHRTVHTWIVNSKGQLLIQKRHPNKESWPNLWDISSAGHISYGETSLEAAHKELREELGITLREGEQLELLFVTKTSDVLHYEGSSRPDYVNNEVVDVYLLQRDIDDLSSELQLQETEVIDARWIDFPVWERLVREGHPAIVASVCKQPDSEYFKLFEILRQRFPYPSYSSPSSASSSANNGDSNNNNNNNGSFIIPDFIQNSNIEAL